MFIFCYLIINLNNHIEKRTYVKRQDMGDVNHYYKPQAKPVITRLYIVVRFVDFGFESGVKISKNEVNYSLPSIKYGV